MINLIIPQRESPVGELCRIDEHGHCGDRSCICDCHGLGCVACQYINDRKATLCSGCGWPLRKPEPRVVEPEPRVVEPEPRGVLSPVRKEWVGSGHQIDTFTLPPDVRRCVESICLHREALLRESDFAIPVELIRRKR